MCRLLLLVAIVMTTATEGQYETKSVTDTAVCDDCGIRISHDHNPMLRWPQSQCREQSHLDATDYKEVIRQLDRASRKSFTQRLSEWFRSERDVDTLSGNDKPRFRINVGIRYRVEVGIMPTAVADLRVGKYTARLALAASFNGCYGVSVSGGRSLLKDRAAVECEADAGRLTVRFWGVGYDAAVKNPRTTYDRLACNFRLSYRHLITQHVRIGVQLKFRNREAQSMSDQARLYLKNADESLTSLQCCSAAVSVEYDGRHYDDREPAGQYIKVEQEVVPKSLSSDNATLWHTSFVADYHQKLWSGGLMVLSACGEFWSAASPWLLWPSVGSSERMRGYRYGRYLARNMISMQVVLRQKIYDPLWAELWGGAAQLFSSAKEFEWRHSLPAYGIGARLELPRGVAISIGYGFGRRADGFMVNVNERF